MSEPAGAQSVLNANDQVSEAGKLYRQGCLREAAEICQQILKDQPANPDALYLLALIISQTGQFNIAKQLVDRAITHNPEAARYHNLRGAILQSQGRLEEAEAHFDQALRLKADFADAHTNRGLCRLGLGDAEGALAAHDQALRIEPDHAVAHVNRGAVLQKLGRVTEAIAAFDEALRIKADFALAHNNRGNVLRSQGRLSEAEAAYQRALSAQPSYPPAYSNYLLCLNYDPAQDDVSLSLAHRAWGERHGRHPDAFTAYQNAPHPDKTLVVGLVSADFGRHPVGYFLHPLLASSNPEQVRFVCYSGRPLNDDLTEELREYASVWRSSLGLSDLDMAKAVRTDGIDILIDLAGHTAGHRLGCFALRPAPVQIHWAGYCHSIPCMDYSLWDPIQVPEGEERWFVEPVVRLPDLRWCYRPPEYAPRVTEPPALQRGYITFGSFNNLTKVNAQVIDLWARVLNELPRTRLLLSWPTLVDAHEAERFRDFLAARGISSERLELRRGAPSHAGVLGEYAEIDIALDPFPFSGCLTTCEALWMGVPMVTLPRMRPVSRQSQAFLTALGRAEWVAQDQDDYVRIATDLASDPVLLATLRRDQRARMAASPVCDGPRFARHFEAALRSIWQSWCARAPAATRNAGERRMEPRNMSEAAAKSVRTRAVTIACCLILATALWSPTPADAQAPVKSLLEMRQDRVVVQQWDLSCGAAALATLLNYQHGDPVSEREIAKGLIQREEYLENPLLVRARHGFSLLDLKRYVEQRGYQGIGYGQLTVSDLIEPAPIMVPVSFNGYNHFVVFRGRWGDRVLLADPAWGNRTLTLDEFEDAWLTYPEFGRVGFVVAQGDGRSLPNRLAPRPDDFVFLR